MNFGQIQRLREYALSRKCPVAMDEQRKELFFAAFTRPVLLGASAAHGHRIDCFKVAGIRYQVDVHLGATASHIFAGCAHVIFHIAAAQNTARIDVFEAGKHLFRRPFGHVHNYVEAPAVTHAHHQFHRAMLSCAL